MQFLFIEAAQLHIMVMPFTPYYLAERAIGLVVAVIDPRRQGFTCYRSHEADAELLLVARQQGRYVYVPKRVLVELDWAKDQASVSSADGCMARVRVGQLAQVSRS